MRHTPLRTLAAVAALGVGYFLAAALGLRWATVSGAASPVFPAAGVALAGLLLGGVRLWPAVFAGALAATALESRLPVWADLSIAAGNTLAYVLAVVALRRVRLDLSLVRLRDVLALIVAALSGAALAATAGTATVAAAVGFGLAQAEVTWMNWWAGDVTGVLLVTPLVLSWVCAPPAARSRPGQVALTTAAAAGISLLVFALPESALPRAFWVFPVLIWAALAGGVRGAATAMVPVAAVAVWGTTRDYGPFAGQVLSLVLIQQFIGIASVTALVLAVVADERRGKEALRQLFESVGTGMAEVDAGTGRFIRVNRRFRELTGYGGEELAGMTFLDLTHPEDRERNRQSVAPVMDGRQDEFAIEKRYLRKDGSTVWVQTTGTALRDGAGRVTRLLGSAYDVTARRQAEEAIRESEDRFRTMADGLPLMVWVHGRDGQQQFVNRTFCEFFGVSQEEMRGGRWQLLMHPDDAAEYTAEFLACVQDRRPFHAEVRVRRADGQWCWIESWGRPRFSGGGEFLGFVGASADVTDRRGAQDALRDADRRKDEFLATLAHELRNPMAAICSAVDLLRIGAGAEADAESIDVLGRQSGQMIRLIDDLLDVSRISRGKINLRSERVALSSVVSQAVQAVRPLCRELNHQLTVSLPPEPLWVEADPARLSQVVGNLLNNACKFTDRGGHLWLAAERAGERAVIRVQDDGIGIAPDHLPRVFEMFAQSDTSLQRPQAGLGIGLSLVKTLVRMHGGTVEAHSAGIGRGSEFVVRLPLAAEVPEAPVAAPAERAELVGSPRLVRRRVLIVEDNHDAARGLARLLSLHGHEVHTAHDGLEAVDVAAKVGPDAILLDIGLPGIDGYEAARRIRSRENGTRPLLVALSGWAQEEDKQRSREAGFDAHLAKPTNFEALLNLLDARSAEKK